MPVVRFSLSDEFFERLKEAADDSNKSLQDYIRFKLFGEESNTIFSVEEAVRRIESGDFMNKEFTLPDVYGNEWTMTKEQGAGALGKNFYLYISSHPELGIRFIPERTKDRRALYTYIGEE